MLPQLHMDYLDQIYGFGNMSKSDQSQGSCGFLQINYDSVFYFVRAKKY